ncbi:MAG TPA: hypothetical protein ENG05_03380 [Acidilobales archaeon]|nr:hypothetical protein [Acidilobales archaeon]
MASLLRVLKGPIAVVGDEFFTLTFRISGASKYYVIKGDLRREDVGRMVKDMMKSNVTLAIIQEDLRKYFEDVEIPASILTTYIPDLKSRPKFNIKEFYLSLIRRYLGISIVLG